MTPMRVVLQASGSRSDLLLLCQYPFGREVEKEVVGEEAVFGTATHEVLAARLRGDKRAPVTSPEVAERARDATSVLMPWLRGDNAWKLAFKPRIIEKSFAWSYARGGRPIASPDENHVYPDLEPDEIAMTLDLADDGHSSTKKPSSDTLMVLDHKTGRDFEAPTTNPQLLTAALALLQPHHKRVILAIGHYPSQGLATIYADEVKPAAVIGHGEAIRDALAKVGDGSLRPGPQCTYCPALRICPTQTNALATLHAPQGLVKWTAEKIGNLHSTLAMYDRLRDKLKDEVIAPWVAENGPAIRPDGKVIDYVDRNFTNFSMATIRRAYGPEKAAEVLEKLEADGAVERGVRRELRAIDDK